ncbi:MAG: DUF86 domain-containing protein [Pseudomonadales bacterium]|nr:DUF86 domain-containing protein [Pseudomonadales bacterium]
MNEVVIQKIVSLQRYVARARDAWERAGAAPAANFDLHDAAVLNVIRACETAIDLANMLIRGHKLGVPAESRESFAIAVREGLIGPELGERLARMVGFRNVAVHQYRELDNRILEAVITRHLDDLLEFAEVVRQAVKD